MSRSESTLPTTDTNKHTHTLSLSLRHNPLIKQPCRTTYRKVYDRHEDLKLVEKSVAEIYQLQLDLALLVTIQQEQLDIIEHHIEEASTNVTDGNETIQDSIQLQKKLRKKQCLLSGIAATCVTIIVFALIL